MREPAHLIAGFVRSQNNLMVSCILRQLEPLEQEIRYLLGVPAGTSDNVEEPHETTRSGEGVSKPKGEEVVVDPGDCEFGRFRSRNVSLDLEQETIWKIPIERQHVMDAARVDELGVQAGK